MFVSLVRTLTLLLCAVLMVLYILVALVPVANDLITKWFHDRWHSAKLSKKQNRRYVATVAICSNFKSLVTIADWIEPDIFSILFSLELSWLIVIARRFVCHIWHRRFITHQWSLWTIEITSFCYSITENPNYFVMRLLAIVIGRLHFTGNFYLVLH